jgi:ATP-dependent 26S proteasome regulatory subunit
MATNRIDSLDPALIRPGRIDRKIEFPLPDEKTRRMIFKIHTGRMTLADDVDLEELVMAKDDLSGADIKVKGIDWPRSSSRSMHHFRRSAPNLDFWHCVNVE